VFINRHLKLFFLFIVALIFLTGLLMIFSTTSAEILDYDLEKSVYSGVLKQFFFGCIGVIVAFFLSRLSFEKLLSYSPLLFLIVTFSLLITLIPGIGKVVNGSRRWIVILGVSWQPSEFAKYIVPLFLCYLLKKYDFQEMKTFLKCGALLSFPIFLVLIEPNNGTAIVMVISLVVLFFLSGVPFKFFALPLLVASFLGGILAMQLPYVRSRIAVYYHPELDLKGRGHQPYQAKIAAGSGQLFGKGPGNSLQKLSYLPEAQNDYIGAIFAEEFGFLGVFFLILLYCFLTVLMFLIAIQSESLYHFYFASVVTFLIGFQAFLNLGVVSGLLPSTGLNLPFFSQGGSSLIAHMSALGVLFGFKVKERGFESTI
jgi:cell division protein FtsW